MNYPDETERDYRGKFVARCSDSHEGTGGAYCMDCDIAKTRAVEMIGELRQLDPRTGEFFIRRVVEILSNPISLPTGNE